MDLPAGGCGNKECIVVLGEHPVMHSEKGSKRPLLPGAVNGPLQS